jgi:hypothetical protein
VAKEPTALIDRPVALWGARSRHVQMNSEEFHAQSYVLARRIEFVRAARTALGVVRMYGTALSALSTDLDRTLARMRALADAAERAVEGSLQDELQIDLDNEAKEE